VRIVLNADDFGFSADTVRATIECFEQGELTSASLMAGMPATEDAIAFALSRPEFSYGVHLTFVGDGTERAAASPEEVSALVADADGHLPPTNVVRLRALLRRLPQTQIEREVVAQISAIRDRGVSISHIDSHRHLHKYKPFREALVRVLPGLGIERVRNVQDVYLRRPLTSPTYWFGRAWRRELMRAFTTTQHFYMPTSTADTDWIGVLSALPRAETLEVGVHPGYAEPWRVGERDSLGAFAAAAIAQGHELVPWTSIVRVHRP
jgi:predicted glycoside hydrolase/deacetylase ChbG (UPF0249 family)